MPLINKTSRLFYLPLVAAAIPFILTASVSAALLAAKSATPAEVATPFLAMTALSIAILVLLGGTIGLLAAQENTTSRRLIDGEFWARWPKYRSDDDWRSYAERQYKTDKEGAGFSWLPVIVVTVLVGIGAIVPGLAGAYKGMSVGDLAPAAAGIGAFYVMLVGGVVGSGLLKKRTAEKTHERRLASPIPSITIGKQGLYDGDEGYTSFGGLNTKLVGVQYKDGSPAALNFKLIVRYSMGVDEQLRTMKETVSVKVLADYREEAKALAERFEKEGLIKK